MSSEQLLVRIDATTEQLRRELRRADQTVERSTKRIDSRLARVDEGFNRLRASVGAVVGILGAQALGRQLVQTANRLEDVGRQADSLGANVETFQELAFAVEQYGGNTNDLTDALGTLSDRAQDAMDGQESFIEDFELLGVAVDDLRDKRPDELFRLMAERVAQIEDPTQRAAGVVRIFGDDLGRRLLPLLRQGREGLDEYAAAAREVDAVHTREGIQRAAEAARTMREVRNTIDAQWAATVVENAEALESMAQAFGEIVKWAGDATTAVANFGESIGENVAGATGGFTQADQLRNEIEAIDLQLRMQRTDHPRQEELRQRWWELRDRLRELTSGGDSETGETGDGGAGGGPVDTGDAGDTGDTGTGESTDTNAERIQRIIDKLREQRATYGQASEAAELYRLRTLGASEAQMQEAESIAQGLEVLRATQQTEEAIAQQRQENAEAQRRRQEERERRIESNRELIQQMEREIELEGMSARARAQAEAVARLSAEATDRQRESVRELAGELYDLRDASEETSNEMSEFAKQAASNTQDAFADFLFDPFQDGLDGMLDGFIRTFRRMAAEGASEQILGSLGGDDGLAGIFDNLGSTVFGGGSSGGGGSGGGWMSAIGSFFGGFFADGGRPPVGQASVVGERGPELFVPQTPGQIISNEDAQEAVRAGNRGRSQQGGGMTRNVMVYQTVNTPDAQSFRKSSTEITRELRRGARA